jgi:hypothetical protein
MSQIGTPPLALCNPRFAESSAGNSIRCPDKPIRRSFDSDRLSGLACSSATSNHLTLVAITSSNLRAMFLIEFL